MKILIKICFFLLFVQYAHAQIFDPVHWSFKSEKLKNNEYQVVLQANIDPHWHVYSQFIGDGGPVKTSIKFTPSADYELLGTVAEEPKAVSAFDPNFRMQIAWHEHQVRFVQKIKLKKSTQIKGSVEFMVCNDTQCLPPTEQTFSVGIQLSEEKKQTAEVAASGQTETKEEIKTIEVDVASKTEPIVVESATESEDAHESLWAIFVAGFLGGLAALFMPCIFPMLPLTISFFTKKAQGNRQLAIAQVAFYGFSIVAIYVLLGILVTLAFGSDALNELASNGIFNLFFFVLLVVFSISFFGAFEITLPSSWVNAMEAQSDRKGLLGILFMAFSLALVSFSCTGPIIGTLLVETAASGKLLAPAIGMFGFSSALAIPFTLFAAFPSVLKSLPKSGSWLNQVKVSLGLLELALSLKFLSNVDLAYHWGIFSRDIYLLLWILIFGAMAVYLSGIFSKTSKKFSIPRSFFALLSLGFAVYLVPGLYGAPLDSLSGFLPPQESKGLDLFSDRVIAKTSHKKYGDQFHSPHGLDAFFDYEEGLAYARKVNKPVLLDFTGHSCVNCRKMEASVWSQPEVLKRLKNDFVLVSLYVDDKTDLPEKEQYVSSFSGKTIKTLGNKWSDFQASTYRTNAQPYYVIINHQGQMLNTPHAFDLDTDAYIRFLDEGKRAFEK